MSVVQMARPSPTVGFEIVSPDDVSAVWDLIRPGLDEVANFGDHWRPEDIYMALRQGSAHLHLAKVESAYAGFVVAMPSRTYDGPVLHVWAVYAVPGFPRLRRECFAKLHELAVAIKARRITFTSPRKGWERLGERFGFSPVLTIFECEVDL